MPSSVISTLLHVLELLVVFAAAYVLVNLFKIPLDPELAGFLLAALAKFARASDSIPLPDFVNEK